jgi:SAM-dependent methyltransferase
MTSTEQWAQALAAWAIPPEILAAPQSPWGFSTQLFAHKADTLPAEPTPSAQRALEALPQSGSVMDVGCGAGAGALPLASRAASLIGVDPSAEMLQAFRARAEATGRTVATIEGAWPEAADRTPVADVVVCHHVVYNVADLAPFLLRLTDHARRRVVLEMTLRHPMSDLNDLWLRFHNLVRPTTPTADDAVRVLGELELVAGRYDWMASSLLWSGPTARQDLVAWTRRRLCLPEERDAEIDAALTPRLLERDGTVSLPPRPVVTLWWSGSADTAASG